ncbi:uncharacterized protein B0T23DRAFT_59871 [Neurospora hispaniola]|uniref:Cyanovirin-N domain-containing protein n=1 Tax=Neurospora hispaniola TaxID=588809 RepID=A0AAJ0IC88_9PEZI|nr:hypothetical protein B0T23DRAFT_59871 [Neurospora hispaniola]
MARITHLASSAVRGITTLTLLTGGFFSVFAQKQPNGGYAIDCIFTGASLREGHWLGCNCLNDDVAILGYNYTWLDLNFCLGNRNGTLESYDTGNYTTTCRDCRILNNYRTIFLNCLCPDMAHVLHNTTLDLNTTLYNVNGCAGCYNHMGNKSWDGPPPSSSNHTLSSISFF